MENKEFFENVDGAGVATKKPTESPVAPTKRKKYGKYGNPPLVKLFIVCLLIVPMAIFCLFTVYGNLGGLIQAFLKYNDKTLSVEFAGWDNFSMFFREFRATSMHKIIPTSFGYLFVVMFISVPISLVSSFFLYKKVPFSKLIVVLLFMPNILPLSVIAAYYRELLDAQVGVLTKILNFLFGYEQYEVFWLQEKANSMLYLYTVYFGFGYNAILIWGAMTRIPEEIVESANLDGANLLVEFFRITIPVIWPTLSMVIVLTWMVPFTVYNQPLMLDFGGEHGTMTWSLYVMNTVKSNQYYASALSIMSAIISIPTTLILKKALEKIFPVVEV